jgi:hypothetical protein
VSVASLRFWLAKGERWRGPIGVWLRGVWVLYPPGRGVIDLRLVAVGEKPAYSQAINLRPTAVGEKPTAQHRNDTTVTGDNPLLAATHLPHLLPGQ